MAVKAKLNVKKRSLKGLKDGDVFLTKLTKSSDNVMISNHGEIGQWYDSKYAGAGWADNKLPEETLLRLKNFATMLLAHDVALFKKKSNKGSEATWMATVAGGSGTLNDRNAALTVLVTNSPLYSGAFIESLLGMCRKQNRREKQMSLNSLKSLWLEALLPISRKLIPFSKRPFGRLYEISGGSELERNRFLLFWWFEDQLKNKYESYIREVEKASFDQVHSMKKDAVSIIFNLLVKAPEQEKILLEMLTNKLGDPDLKIASLTALLLTKLVDEHPQMKSIVVREVERILYRPNISPKAQYYGVCFMTQIILSEDDESLAASLIRTYVAFFKACIKKDEMDSKLLSALLSGVNRAYPFAKGQVDVIEDLDSLYKIVHVSTFNVGLQALMVLYQVVDRSGNISDRYYTALYKKLCDRQLISTPKQALFLNTLYKTLKRDEMDRRVKAFLKRLLQICSQHRPPFICGALILVSELLHLKPDLLTLTESKFIDDFDEEEGTVGAVKSSWDHQRNLGPGASSSGRYDALHRNPLYAGAEHALLWELSQLSTHYHPSVALFAARVLTGNRISYDGDPLQDFSLMKFLDRFVYRNPKKADKSELPHPQRSVLMSKKQQYQPRGVKSLAVTSTEYAQKPENSIPQDEKYLHRFFSQNLSSKHSAESRKEEHEDVSDDEFDNILDKLEPGLVQDDDDEDFLEMDFSRFGEKKTKSKGSKIDLDNASDDDMDSLDDEEVDLGDLSDLDDELSDEEEGEHAPLERDLTKGKGAKRKRSSGDIFSAADEFGSLLEESGANKLTSNALRNEGNISNKQLKWEEKRVGKSKSFKGRRKLKSVKISRQSNRKRTR